MLTGQSISYTFTCNDIAVTYRLRYNLARRSACREVCVDVSLSALCEMLTVNINRHSVLVIQWNVLTVQCLHKHGSLYIFYVTQTEYISYSYILLFKSHFLTHKQIYAVFSHLLYSEFILHNFTTCSIVFCSCPLVTWLRICFIITITSECLSAHALTSSFYFTSFITVRSIWFNWNSSTSESINNLWHPTLPRKIVMCFSFSYWIYMLQVFDIWVLVTMVSIQPLLNRELHLVLRIYYFYCKGK